MRTLALLAVSAAAALVTACDGPPAPRITELVFRNHGDSSGLGARVTVRFERVENASLYELVCRIGEDGPWTAGGERTSAEKAWEFWPGYGPLFGPVEDGVVATYRMRALVPFGWTDWSGTESVFIPVRAPDEVVVRTLSEEPGSVSVEVAWKHRSTSADRARIERTIVAADDTRGEWTPVYEGPPTGPFVDAGAPAPASCTRYAYRVTLLAGELEGAPLEAVDWTRYPCTP